MKEQVSAIEIYHLVKELQVLENGRIEKVYQEGNLHYWRVYSGGEKRGLLIELPNVLYLTENKPNFKPPTGFATFLRKRIQRGIIRSIEQVRFDRIVKMYITTKDSEFHLYIELFSKGNFILCDTEDKIVSAQNSIVFADRSLKRGEQYQLPEEQQIIYELSESEFKKAITDKKELARNGFGGEYADYLFEGDSYKNVQEAINNPQPNITENSARILAIDDTGEPTATLSEAISKLLDPARQKAKQEEKLKAVKKVKSKYENIAEAQEKQISKLTKKQEEDQRKGELLFEHYQEVDQLLAQAQKDRRALDKDAFKKKYRNHPLVKQANPQQFVITLEEQ